jgi:hypothetical protein
VVSGEHETYNQRICYLAYARYNYVSFISRSISMLCWTVRFSLLFKLWIYSFCFGMLRHSMTLVVRDLLIILRVWDAICMVDAFRVVISVTNNVFLH